VRRRLARTASGQAPVAVIQEAYVKGISTRKVDDLVQAMEMTGISKGQVSHLCAELDDRVTAFVRLVGTLLAEQTDERQVTRRYMSQESLARVIDPEPAQGESAAHDAARPVCRARRVLPVVQAPRAGAIRAERAIRPVAMGKRNWMFAGNEEGARRIGIIQSLLASCKLQGIDPRTWLIDVLQRVGCHPASQVHELTPRLWKTHWADHPSGSDVEPCVPPHRTTTAVSGRRPPTSSNA
jgi:hypothetical protein